MPANQPQRSKELEAAAYSVLGACDSRVSNQGFENICQHIQTYAEGYAAHLVPAEPAVTHPVDLLNAEQGENTPILRKGGTSRTIPIRTPKPTHSGTGELLRKFSLGESVTKTKGSKWTGKVVGFYSTTLTPVGYAVESATEVGSVQIYPETALSAIHQGPEQHKHYCSFLGPVETCHVCNPPAPPPADKPGRSTLVAEFAVRAANIIADKLETQGVEVRHDIGIELMPLFHEALEASHSPLVECLELATRLKADLISLQLSGLWNSTHQSMFEDIEDFIAAHKAGGK